MLRIGIKREPRTVNTNHHSFGEELEFELLRSPPYQKYIGDFSHRTTTRR